MLFDNTTSGYAAPTIRVLYKRFEDNKKNNIRDFTEFVGKHQKAILERKRFNI